MFCGIVLEDNGRKCYIIRNNFQERNHTMYDLFSLPDFQLPGGFIFGSATAAYQIEGNNIHTNRWQQELHGEYITEASGNAVDGYRQMESDMELLKQIGHKAYRFSIEWARIEPAEGVWNHEAIEHYLRQCRILKEAGIQVWLTLVHCSLPEWFAQKGGFRKANFPYFLRYVEKMGKLLNDYVDVWIVLNEFFSGGWGGDDMRFDYIKAHAAAYHALKQFSEKPVTSAHAAVEYYPTRSQDELDRLEAQRQTYFANGVLLRAIRTGELAFPGFDGEWCPEVKDTMDFWAINNYRRQIIDTRKKGPAARFGGKNMRMCPNKNDEFWPEGLSSMLQLFSGDRPVAVTENGCATFDDRFRIVWIALYLNAVKEAIDRGANVLGYFYWSLLDNFEWDGTFDWTFGLIGVDRKDYSRTIRPSAYFYRDIIENNGFSQKILRKYLTQMPSMTEHSYSWR